MSLMNHGVPEANICLSDICTHCAEGYHSYRQNKTKERIYNFILNR